MTKTSRRVAAGTTAAVLLFATALAAQLAPPIAPTSPAAATTLTWSRALKMPDGRMFVSDGGMLVDATVAKPATMPTTVLPPETGTRYAAYFTAPHDHEFRLAELKPVPGGNNYVTPDGVGVNGNYVRFLVAAAPPNRITVHTRGPRNPMTVFTGTTPIAVVMPMVLPQP